MMAGLAFFKTIARLPRPIWYILAVLVAVALMWRWHIGRIDAAYTAGGTAQAILDGAAFEKAAVAAEAAQAAVKAALVVRQGRVTKGTEDALLAKNADLSRRYDDLRLRWAAYHAGERGAGESGATIVSGAARGIDDAACAAQGWVSFDTAAAAAEAADVAIARDDAWRAWVLGQKGVWVE